MISETSIETSSKTGKAWTPIPFEIAHKDATVNPKAIFAIGTSPAGWLQPIDWNVGLFPLPLTIVFKKGSFRRTPLVRRIEKLQNDVRRNMIKNPHRVWISPKLYISVFDGEIANQAVSFSAAYH